MSCSQYARPWGALETKQHSAGEGWLPSSTALSRGVLAVEFLAQVLHE